MPAEFRRRFPSRHARQRQWGRVKLSLNRLLIRTWGWFLTQLNTLIYNIHQNTGELAFPQASGTGPAVCGLPYRYRAGAHTPHVLQGFVGTGAARGGCCASSSGVSPLDWLCMVTTATLSSARPQLRSTTSASSMALLKQRPLRSYAPVSGVQTRKAP